MTRGERSCSATRHVCSGSKSPEEISGEGPLSRRFCHYRPLVFEVMIERLDGAVHSMNAAHSDALREIALLDEQRVWRRDGATCMTSWLSGRYGLTWATAQEWVRVARRLRELPAISRAYACGR